MAKCPHCNGLLEIRAIRHPHAEKPDSVQNEIIEKVRQWVDTPAPMSTLLLDMGYEGNLARYEPLDQPVYRTAFRAKDFIASTGMKAVPEFLHQAISELPGWVRHRSRERYFGVQGRYWTRVGFHGYPGFISAGDFEEIDELV